MAQMTLTELRSQAKGRPENLTIEMPDGTQAVLVNLLLLPNERRDLYLNKLEAFMALSVDENSNREERRKADKATGRKVGTTKGKAKTEAETDKKAETDSESFTQEDLAEFIGQVRDGLVDVDKVYNAAGEVIEAVILDKDVAKKTLAQLDAIDRAQIIQVHLSGDQQGEA